MPPPPPPPELELLEELTFLAPVGWLDPSGILSMPIAPPPLKGAAPSITGDKKLIKAGNARVAKSMSIIPITKRPVSSIVPSPNTDLLFNNLIAIA